MSPPAWSQMERLPDAGAAPRVLMLSADEPTRAAVARQLDLPAVHRLEGRVRMRPWLDGAELQGEWSATVTYTCGVTLEPFDQPLEGAFTMRVVPSGSLNAPSPEAEASLDPDAPEPPDVIEGGAVDVAAYLVEHLALELDPYPRKPGAEFVQPEEPEETSPFAKLLQLRRESDGEG